MSSLGLTRSISRLKRSILQRKYAKFMHPRRCDSWHLYCNFPFSMNRWNHDGPGKTGSRPFAAARGEVYADEGTLILQPRSVPHAPPSHRASYASWSDDRGNWDVPTPGSTRSAHSTRSTRSALSAAPPAKSDSAVMAMAGLVALAIFAGFAAVLLALSGEDKRADQPAADEGSSATALAAAPPPAPSPLPVVRAVDAPVFELPDTSPAAPVVAPVLRVSAQAPASAPKPKKASAATKSQQEILEDLLEQQLRR
jgi:hypothetical protein